MSEIDQVFLKIWREKYRWPLHESRKASEEGIISLENLVKNNILKSGSLGVKQVLLEIVRWKASRRWEKQMLERFDRNDEHVLEERVSLIRRKLGENPNGVSICVDLLSRLRGVGIPLASAFLRFLDPVEHRYGIIDNNVARVLNERMITNFDLREEDNWIKKCRTNINQYQKYHEWLQRKATELKGVTYTDIYDVQRNFAPVDVEMALFAYATQ